MRKLCPFFPLTVAHPSGTLFPHRKAAWAVITLWFAQDEVMQVSTVISLCPPLFWLSFWNELGLFVKVTCPSSVGVMLQLDWLQSWCLWKGEISSIPYCSISLSVPQESQDPWTQAVCQCPVRETLPKTVLLCQRMLWLTCSRSHTKPPSRSPHIHPLAETASTLEGLTLTVYGIIFY